VAGLASVNDLGAFHRVLSAQGLLAPGSRFVDLEIDVSNKCNIRCRMCYFSFDRVFHAKPAYLTPETFEPIADAILPHARALMLSLGSEPLTSPHFIPILALAARYRVPEVGFYTNGLMMGDRIIDAILEHQVTLVAVSVDAATKQTFESIRRGADFDVLLANVRRLVRRRAEAGRSQPRIRFGVILMRRNIEELPDLVTLAWRLGVEELNFFHAAIYEGLEMEGESLVHHRRLSNECLARAGALADDLGLKIVHHPEPFDLESPDGVARPAAPPPAGPYCRFPFFHVSIDAEGRVLACPFSHGEAPYGVVSRETSFEQIWLGGSFAALRRRILNNDPPPMCRRCTFLASSQPHRAELFAARPH
jgi:MoaA/NifB/PqqE/SkfB family radical SAM enzyme